MFSSGNKARSPTFAYFVLVSLCKNETGGMIPNLHIQSSVGEVCFYSEWNFKFNHLLVLQKKNKIYVSVVSSLGTSIMYHTHYHSFINLHTKKLKICEFISEKYLQLNRQSQNKLGVLRAVSETYSTELTNSLSRTNLNLFTCFKLFIFDRKITKHELTHFSL